MGEGLSPSTRLSLFHRLKEFYVQKWLMIDAEKPSITDMQKVGALEAKEAKDTDREEASAANSEKIKIKSLLRQEKSSHLNKRRSRASSLLSEFEAGCFIGSWGPPSS